MNISIDNKDFSFWNESTPLAKNSCRFAILRPNEVSNADLFELKKLRAEVLGSLDGSHVQSLITDKWDNTAVHVFVYTGNELVGAVRLVAPSRNGLPITDIVGQLHPPIRAGEYEISRLYIKRSGRKRMPILQLVKGLSMAISENCDHLLADGLIFEKLGIRESRYLESGFFSSGVEYMDVRYNRRSKVFRTTAYGKTRLVNYLDRIWKKRL